MRTCPHHANPGLGQNQRATSAETPVSTLPTTGSPGRNTALMFLRFSAAALLLALLLLLVQAPPTWSALAVLAALLGLLPSLRRPQHNDRERQLLEAIEAMPAGFDLWDADDRLLMCNRRVREDYAQVAEHLVEGQRFEDVVRQSLQAGYLTEARGREEAWLAERLAGRGQQSGPRLQQFGERWLHLYEQRTASGLLVCIRLDVTELVKTQQALAEAQAAAHSERQLLERAIDAMPAGIEIYDEHDRLLLANRRVIGWMPHLDYEAHARQELCPHAGAEPRGRRPAPGSPGRRRRLDRRAPGRARPQRAGPAAAAGQRHLAERHRDTDARGLSGRRAPGRQRLAAQGTRTAGQPGPVASHHHDGRRGHRHHRRPGSYAQLQPGRGAPVRLSRRGDAGPEHLPVDGRARPRLPRPLPAPARRRRGCAGAAPGGPDTRVQCPAQERPGR